MKTVGLSRKRVVARPYGFWHGPEFFEAMPPKNPILGVPITREEKRESARMKMNEKRAPEKQRRKKRAKGAQRKEKE